MIAIAEKIFADREVVAADGKPYPLKAETSQAQCEFLQKVIREIDARDCIEVGLAYGISSLFIGEAIAQKPDCRLTSIDPLQEHWHHIGVTNMERAGYGDFFEFHHDWTYRVLPKLLSEGRTIDFAYVDTSKVFDTILMDGFYLTRMLRKGGVIVFDDCQWPGINRAVRYLAQWPHLKVYATHGEGRTSRKRALLSKVVRCLPLGKELFAHDFVLTDDMLGMNAPCVAFQKIDDDSRSWDWDVRF